MKPSQIASIASIAGLFFFATWTYAFGDGRWLFPSSIAAGLVFASFALTLIADRNRVDFKPLSHDFAFLGFLALALLSGLMHPNSKTINYGFAYLYSFVGLSIVLRLMIVGYRDSLSLFLLANVAGIGFISAFVIFEFFCSYILGISIQALIPRNNLAVADFAIFRRAYGFAEEPTYVAWHLNTLGTLAVWTVWTRWPTRPWRNAAFTAAALVALCVTFSGAGLICLIAGSIVGGVSYWLDRERPALNKTPLINSARTLAVAAIIVFGLALPSPKLFHTDDLAKKINGSNSYALAKPLKRSGGSALHGFTELQGKVEGEMSYSRQKLWLSHIPYLQTAPMFGQGPGYLSSKGEQSSVNLFLFMAVEDGIPASVALGLGFFLILVTMLRSKLPSRHIFALAFTAGAIHFITMTQHYHPAIWLLIATFFATQRLHNESIFGCELGRLSRQSRAQK